MFTVVCDNCQKDIGSTQEYSCWDDSDFAIENAMNSDWIAEYGKHYCTECYSYDDNDALIINSSRTKDSPTVTK